jgi:ribose 5-phosphate isomerase A
VDVETEVLEDPAEFDARLRSIPGVIETGLFCGLAERAFLGRADGVREILLP